MSVTFGTDGVRGRAYDELTLEDSSAIGRAAATVFAADLVVIGLDTRESSIAVGQAVAAGASAQGAAVAWLGVAPTPAVAHYSRQHDAIGVMISASHNPWQDNGIKVFAPGGRKLTDDEQSAMEAVLASPAAGLDRPSDALVAAQMQQAQQAIGDWVSAVHATCPDGLNGLRLIVDAAHGAASFVAGPLLTDLGATVEVINAAPTGRNINERCGSTDPAALAAAVVAAQADVGVALDGDADRMLAVDATGSVVDGDAVIAICALDLAARGSLANGAVAVTVMTNLGFRKAMEEHDIGVVETPVGDRHVLAAMEANDLSLGGEQSGHVIFRDALPGHSASTLAATGDGLLTAVQLLSVVRRSASPLHELAAQAMVRLPQVLRNVRVGARPADVTGDLSAEIAAAEESLGADGRVLIRVSGTEPLVRVMVEAATEELAGTTCGSLVAAVERRYA